MEGSSLWRIATADDFPNRLATGQTEVTRPKWSWLAILLLLCLIPRSWEALHRETVWTDSITYHEASLALQRGDYDKAFEYLGLNIYPLVLWAMRALGLGWEVAGTWWSVACGTLAVLPLFGWVRRQFDDRIALCAGVLYAVHGRLIAVSSLVLRDAMFWLLMLLSLYYVWRAIVELRWRFFLLGGVCLTLCVHVRTEGWFLLPLAAAWAAIRFLALGKERTRLFFGVLAMFAIIPISVAAVNLTLLRSSSQWSFVRPNQVAVVESHLQRDPQDATAAQNAPQSDFAPPTVATGISVWTNARRLGQHWVKAHGYLHFSLAILGIFSAWKVYFRRDHLAVWAMAGLLLAAIWLRSLRSANDVRYFFPVVLTAFPWMAIGFWTMLCWATQRAKTWRAWRFQRPIAAAALVLIAAAPAHWESRLSWCKFMDGEAAIGRWIRCDIGPGVSIRSNMEDLRLVQYYSESRSTEPFSVQAILSGQPADWLDRAPPDLIVVCSDRRHGPGFSETFADSLLDRRELGYCRIPAERLPAECTDMIVLARGGKAVAATARAGAAFR